MRCFLILSLIPGVILAMDVLSLRNQAMENLKAFQPAIVIPEVTTLEQSEPIPDVKKEPLDDNIIRDAEKLLDEASSDEGLGERYDHTKSEESDDIAEGITQIGALSESLDALSQNHFVSIFSGVKQECERFIWGTRDCCQDSGFLDGLIHCPRELQALQHAKLEHRVVYIGHYKNNPIATTRYVYCVFPTKLAGVMQIQGRGHQLHIPFGHARKPDCRGITPDELASINFKALDLSALTEAYMQKQAFPNEVSDE